MTRLARKSVQDSHALDAASNPAGPAMIEEAIVDAYTESEQVVGFHAAIDMHLDRPFETVVLGVAATVKKVDVTTAGWEWIEAHRRWARGHR